MAKQSRLSLTWVFSYKDSGGNCEVDELARRGATRQFCLDKTRIGMPFGACRLLLQKYIFEQAATRCNDITTCR